MSRLLVTGSDGQLGGALMVAESNFERVACGRALDVRDRVGVSSAIEAAQPGVIIHAAAWTDVDGCELDPLSAEAINAVGTATVAEAADAVGAHLIYISTDYVFDGTKVDPYIETDKPNPLSVYGRSKLAGEQAALAFGATVVRTSWVFSSEGNNIVRTVLRSLNSGLQLRFVTDQRGHPTCAVDLASALLRLAAQRPGGIWHLTNNGPASWYEFACAIAGIAGFSEEQIEPISTLELLPPRPARRPSNSMLANTLWHDQGFTALADFRVPLATVIDRLSAG